MTARRPLVVVGGDVQELPAGDVLLGVGSVPFYNASGALDVIPLTLDGKLPFVKADGVTHSDIPLTV